MIHEVVKEKVKRYEGRFCKTNIILKLIFNDHDFHVGGKVILNLST